MGCRQPLLPVYSQTLGDPWHLFCGCRYTYLLDLAVQHRQPLLLVGASGTGKTSIITAHLLNGGLPADLWMPVCVTLSARTSASMLQDQVGGRCRLHACGWIC